MKWLGDYFGDFFADWFGAGTQPEGSMSAGLSGAGSLSATLTATGTPVVSESSGGFFRGVSRRILDLFRRRPARISAGLSGAGRLRATLSAARPLRSRLLALLADEE